MKLVGVVDNLMVLSLSLTDLTNKEGTMFLEKSKNARKMMSRNGKL